MFRLLSLVGLRSRSSRWGFLAIIVVTLGLSGCCEKCNLRGDNFQDNALADQCRQYRKPDHNNDLFGVSNKAQQIEKDVGVQ